MAMMLGGGSGGKRGRRGLNSEINVTPFVDVMLVLLIVFMITTPMIVRGEEVNLPKTNSGPVAATQDQPLTITLLQDGTIMIQKQAIGEDELVAKLIAITNEGYDQLIYLRGDERVELGRAVELMSRVRAAGFTKLAIVTDPKGPDAAAGDR